MDANPFAEHVVEAVKRHMNTDHADDSVLICRALGGQPDAVQATMTGMDADGIDFAVIVDSQRGEELPVRIAWSKRLSERAEVRAEVVRMYREACTALGVTPRGAE